MVSYRLTNLPAIRDGRADVEIPVSAWSNWTPEFGPKQLRRELTQEERGVLERRVNELAPALAPYPDADLDRVALALTDMFSGYTSMRQSDDEAVAKLDSARRVLTPFPAWAIEKACEKIHTNGVWRDGKFDRRWPPNDSEVIAAVRDEVAHYEIRHRSAIRLLSATVEGARS